MLFSWRSVKTIWLSEKAIIIPQFIEQNVPLDLINSTLQFFEEMEMKYSALPFFRKLGVLGLNLKPLQQSVCCLLIEWRDSLGKAVLDKTLDDLVACKDKINVCVLYSLNYPPLRTQYFNNFIL